MNVRAPYGKVAVAGDYPWSSHAANIGTRTIFASSFDPIMEKVIRESTNGGYPLASDAFKADVIAPLGDGSVVESLGRGPPQTPN